jgi:hypothetical protein
MEILAPVVIPGRTAVEVVTCEGAGLGHSAESELR